MYCAKCGNELREAGRFCSRCGNPIGIKNSNQGNSTNISNEKYVVNANVMIDVICSIILLLLSTIPDNTIITRLMLFGACTFYLIRRLAFSNSLVIDKNGITDNFSYIPKGFMPWSDIQVINIVPSTLGKLMGVKINANSPSCYKLIEIRMNDNTSKYISLLYTGIAPETVLREISKYRPS